MHIVYIHNMVTFQCVLSENSHKTKLRSKLSLYIVLNNGIVCFILCILSDVVWCGLPLCTQASKVWIQNKMDESKHEIHSQVDAITAGTASVVNLTAGKWHRRDSAEFCSVCLWIKPSDLLQLAGSKIINFRERLHYVLLRSLCRICHKPLMKLSESERTCAHSFTSTF